jgi:hypothetical protein
VFVPGRAFQLILMFIGIREAHPRVDHLNSAPLGKAPDL